MRVVSGGQTGVDRAALDAAMELGVKAGGWCPEGRIAEDGYIPGIYPVKELPQADYRQRTIRNVVDSDATAIIYFGYPAGGTRHTLELCSKEGKPYVAIDANEVSVEQAALKIRRLIDQNHVSTLNVAGPRASDEPGAYGYARMAVMKAIQ